MKWSIFLAVLLGLATSAANGAWAADTFPVEPVSAIAVAADPGGGAGGQSCAADHPGADCTPCPPCAVLTGLVCEGAAVSIPWSSPVDERRFEDIHPPDPFRPPISRSAQV